jgi:Glycosyl transferase family 2
VDPLLSIVIPTRDRPARLPEAVQSALGQRVGRLEVIVVDNGSTSPVTVPEDPRLRVIRCPYGGTAAARNAGALAARGRWITCLDDDDRLFPHMTEVSLHALERSALPPPVAVISGVEVVSPKGRVLERRLPPTRPRGAHFALEPLEPGLSYRTKQTLVVERDLLLAVGGWDASFRSLVLTDLFLRLNPVCSIIGLPELTYQHVQHDGYRLSRDPALLQSSFGQLERKHRALLEAHPLGHARLLRVHARRLSELGRRRAAFTATDRALRLNSRRAPAPDVALA